MHPFKTNSSLAMPACGRLRPMATRGENVRSKVAADAALDGGTAWFLKVAMPACDMLRAAGDTRGKCAHKSGG